MKKRNILLVLVLFIGVLVLGGCTNEPRKEAIDFKREYESINNKEIREGLKYKELNIADDNPYIKVDPSEIVKKIENKETFYLYVGDSLCPWCRSGLEKAIEVAKKEGIKDIYYIDFWDDNHKEILRDLYTVEVDKKGKAKFTKTQEATDAYKVIIEAVKDYVQDYTIDKDGKTYNVGVKRTFGGDHFYFKDGKCVKYMTLRSPKLKNAFDPLTEEVLKDQEETFTKFFKN